MIDSAPLQRAEGLRERLHELTGTTSRQVDVLRDYRLWLDTQDLLGIVAERNGWPSDDAYAEDTILRFVAECYHD